MGRARPGLRDNRGRHNLGAPLSSFLGRGADLDGIEASLDRHRLVTLTGPGGSGKTRLADQLSRRVVDRFKGGVWLVELAPVEDATVVPEAVASALGVHQQPGLSMVESVVEALAGRHVLLVVDNCEHVVEAAAGLCETLLRANEDLRLLATSRQPLGVIGEAQWPVGPLPTPGDEPDQAVGDCAAVQLFVERARQVDPGFRLTPSSGPLISRIVRGLDGMPLAIELAAARVGTLGADEVAARLDDRFRLLVTGTRSTPARHRSLGATVEWSYRLLSNEERRVFQCLSVFPAPFTATAAEAAAGPDAVEILVGLVERSLVSAARPGVDGRFRHRMLETLRAFAAERLAESKQRAEVEQAVLGWAEDEASRANRELEGSGRLDAARWFDAEHDNLRQALERAVNCQPEAALRLAVALGAFWALRGRYSEGRALLESALAGFGSPPPELAAAAHISLGRLARGLSDHEAAIGHYTAVIEQLVGSVPQPLVVDSLVGRSNAIRNLMRTTEATVDAKRALSIARAIGYADGECAACYALGLAALYEDNPQEGHLWALQAYEIDPNRLSATQLQDRSCLLSVALFDIGDFITAERVSAEGLQIARETGDPNREAFHLSCLADLSSANGRWAEAALYVEEALRVAAGVGDRLRIWDCLGAASTICVERAQPEEGALIWGARQRLTKSLGLGRVPLEAKMRAPAVETMRRSLGPQRLRAAELRGASMDVESAVELARSLMLKRSDAQSAARTPVSPLGASGLSEREREILAEVALGATDAQIAQRLFVSINTIRSHLERIRDKTGARRRPELVRYATRAGIVTPDLQAQPFRNA